MKLILRSAIAFLFLIAFAFPSLAQSKIAIRTAPLSSSCVIVSVKNLQTAPLNASAAYLMVFDQNTCKKACDTKIALNRNLNPCELFRFKLCCSHALPAKYIAYVKIFYAGGYSEDWLWN